MITCPRCKSEVTGYSVSVDFIFDDYRREKSWEHYLLVPCGCVYEDLAVQHRFIEEDITGVAIFEGWLYDTMAEEKVISFLDHIPEGESSGISYD